MSIKDSVKRNNIAFNVLKTPYRFLRELLFAKILGALFRLRPIRNNKVVASNFNGKGFGDNTKYIVETLMNKKNNLDVVWLVDDRCDTDCFPEKIRLVRKYSLRSVYELATAKLWIDNVRKDFYPRKRKGQIYIQLWHGSMMLKKIENDAADVLPKKYIRGAKEDSKMADYIVSGNKFNTNIIKSAFWYDGKILEYGTPKYDKLVKVHNRKKEHSISKGCKFIIYAPTFRDDGSMDAYGLDYEKIIAAAQKKFGGEWKILLRLHPNVVNNQKNKLDLPDSVTDVSDYADLYELMLLADILITDYSCVMFEFALTGKPVFLYAEDIEKYRSERGWYFTVEELPFSLSASNYGLEKQILEFDEDEYKQELDKFLEDLGSFECGDSSDKIANVLLKDMKKKENML